MSPLAKDLFTSIPFGRILNQEWEVFFGWGVLLSSTAALITFDETLLTLLSSTEALLTFDETLLSSTEALITFDETLLCSTEAL